MISVNIRGNFNHSKRIYEKKKLSQSALWQEIGLMSFADSLSKHKKSYLILIIIVLNTSLVLWDKRKKENIQSWVKKTFGKSWYWQTLIKLVTVQMICSEFVYNTISKRYVCQWNSHWKKKVVYNNDDAEMTANCNYNRKINIRF